MSTRTKGRCVGKYERHTCPGPGGGDSLRTPHGGQPPPGGRQRHLDEQRRVLLPPAVDGRNAALVELNITAGAAAAEVAGRFLDRFASVFGGEPAGLPPSRACLLRRAAAAAVAVRRSL